MWDPHWVRTEPTSTGFFLSLQSKMWMPSQPAGTAWPPQVSPAPNAPGVPAGVFHERMTRFFQTETSPWFPSQKARETVKGLFGSRMFRMLKPSQFPWMANWPQNAMSVLMSSFAPPKPPSTLGSSMWPSGARLKLGSVVCPAPAASGKARTPQATAIRTSARRGRSIDTSSVEKGCRRGRGDLPARPEFTRDWRNRLPSACGGILHPEARAVKHEGGPGGPPSRTAGQAGLSCACLPLALIVNSCVCGFR